MIMVIMVSVIIVVHVLDPVIPIAAVVMAGKQATSAEHANQNNP